MTVSKDYNKHVYEGNGLTRDWPYDFDLPITAAGAPDTSLIHVFRTNLRGEVSEVTTGYSINAETGTLTYPTSGSPLESGEKLTILRLLDVRQQFFDPSNQANLYPETLEDNTDRLVMMVQQLQEETDRAVKVSVSTDLETEDITAEGIFEARDIALSAAETAEGYAAQLPAIADELGVNLVTDEADLRAKLAAIGESNATLVIATTIPIAADLAIPSNVALSFKKTGQLQPASGETLTINGPIDAGLWQIFGGDGASILTMHDGIWAAWYGLSTSNTGEKNATILQKIIESSLQGRTIKVHTGTFPMAPDIICPTGAATSHATRKFNVCISGVSPQDGYQGWDTDRTTIFEFTTSGAVGIDLSDEESYYNTIENITFTVATDVTVDACIKFCGKQTIRNCQIGRTWTGFAYGLWGAGYVNSTSIQNCSVTGNQIGLYLTGEWNTVLYIDNCHFRSQIVREDGDLGNGMRIHSIAGLRVKNSVIESNQGEGIFIYRSSALVGACSDMVFDSVHFENNNYHDVFGAGQPEIFISSDGASIGTWNVVTDVRFRNCALAPGAGKTYFNINGAANITFDDCIFHNATAVAATPFNVGSAAKNISFVNGSARYIAEHLTQDQIDNQFITAVYRKMKNFDSGVGGTIHKGEICAGGYFSNTPNMMTIYRSEHAAKFLINPITAGLSETMSLSFPKTHKVVVQLKVNPSFTSSNTPVVISALAQASGLGDSSYAAYLEKRFNIYIKNNDLPKSIVLDEAVVASDTFVSTDLSVAHSGFDNILTVTLLGSVGSLTWLNGHQTFNLVLDCIGTNLEVVSVTLVEA